jgi:putative salt-induced outer membrane protein YdiY
MQQRTNQNVRRLLRWTVTPALLCWAGATVLGAAPAKEGKWESSAGIGLTLTSGNSDTVLVTGNAQTSRKWDQNELRLGVEGGYGEVEGDRNIDYVRGFGQYNRLFNERLYGYVRADALHDAIAEVDYRVTLSPGLGYYFIKEEKVTLSGEVGPGYVFEKVDGDENDYLTLRLAERFEWKISKTARLWQYLEYLPEVDDFENYIINGEIGVAADITKNLALKVYLQDTYDNMPAPGREENDLKLVAGIDYKF